MITDNFDSRSEDELDIICNVVSILLVEFDHITKVTEEEGDSFAKKMENHKTLCYYVMNNCCVEEEKVIC